METIIRDVLSLPMWAIVSLVLAVLILGNWWIGYVGRHLAGAKLPGDQHFWQLLRLVVSAGLAAGLVSAALVTYWIGTDVHYNPLTWGLYGRGAFVVLLVGTTSFFTKLFKR